MNVLPKDSSWASTGAIWPFGIPISQSWLDIGMILRIIFEMNIRFVFEVGVHRGGLAEILIKYPGLGYAGVEITENIIEPRVNQQDIRIGNAWSDEILKWAGRKIETTNGTAFVLCDGGNKIKDLKNYFPLLRKGDFIACHDFGKEVFQENLEPYYDYAIPFRPDWVADTNWFVMEKL